MKIYLSPSVQEHNIGYGNYGTEEYRMNQIADVVEKILKRYEIEVFRNTEKMKLSEIIRASKKANVDYHISIHSNASRTGKARGCEVYAYSKTSKGFELSKKIYDRLSEITPTSDRGVQVEPRFYELKETNAPACLVEVDFHDNPESSKWIINNIEPIGEGIAYGTLEQVGIDPIQTQYKNLKARYEDLKEKLWHLYREA